MTSSFGITPQRQVRDLVARPETPASIPEPAKPSQIPQQVGGQLLYGRSPEVDPGPSQTLQVIQDIIKKGGAFDKGMNLLGEKYYEDRKRQALKLYEQEATAYKDTAQIGEDTEKLKAKKQFELARENQLRNPWINFFYYDKKSTDAGQLIAIDLAAWGKQQVGPLSRIQNPSERSARITAKVDELLKPYADLPASFVAAKIDPLIAQTKTTLNGLIAAQQIENNEEAILETTYTAFRGALLKGIKLGEAGAGTREGAQFSANAAANAYKAGYDYYVTQMKYDEKAYHEILFDLIPTLQVDLDSDNKNDFADSLTYNNLLNSLKQFKTKDGQNILELVRFKDGKRQTMLEAIQNGLSQQMIQYDKIENSRLNQINAAKRVWKENTYTDTMEFLRNNPSQAARNTRRQELKEAIDNFKVPLPFGMTQKDAKDYVDELIPEHTRQLDAAQLTQFKMDLAELKAENATELPPAFVEKYQGTKELDQARVEIFDYKVQSTNPDVSSTLTGMLRRLTAGLDSNIRTATQEMREIGNLKADQRSAREPFIKKAILDAQLRFTSEVSPQLKNDLIALGDRINDPNEIAKLEQKYKDDYYNRPVYNSVAGSYDIVAGQNFKPKDIIPVGPESTYVDNKGWTINVNDTDNRAAWSISARDSFVGQPAKARQYIKDRFVFNQKEMSELLTLGVANPDGKKISLETRRSMRNVMYALGVVSPAEIVKAQNDKFYSRGQKPPIQYDDKFINELFAAPVASTGFKPRDLHLYVSNQGEHSHSANAAIDFFMERGNRTQTANNLPSPISGTVIFAGPVDGYGLTVVIENERTKDRQLIAHAAQLYVSEGQRVVVGSPLLKAGDGSPVNSIAGRSTTGRGTPGHLHSQLFKPGKGFPQQSEQYGQYVQQYNFKQKFYPLFKTQEGMD